jgi:subtilisin family serine protease
MPEEQFPIEIAPVEPPPVQFEEKQIIFDIEIDQFLWVNEARAAFRVSGKGLTVAVLDTGLNTGHVDFAGRIVDQRNFTPDNGGNVNDATDGNGHGTNVGGIIVANADHVGIAPEANIIPLKVLGDTGGGSFQWINSALQWVLDNQAKYNITVVCMSLGDGSNRTSDDNLSNDGIRKKIRELRNKRVAVTIAAGNDYFKHKSQQGMGYPAIIRECVSVGAVYDAAEGSFSYGSGAKAHSTRAGQITPFSQRLHPTVNRHTRTDIFAPGAPVTSSGIRGPHGESIQHGTSQATPVTAGIILLMQEFYNRAEGEMPRVDDLVKWLRRGGVSIHDGDDEDDNVEHTNRTFLRADVMSAMDAVRRQIQKNALRRRMS